MATITRVSKLNLNTVRPQRGGIIIYTVFEGVLYYGVCIDATTHDITDAGGSIDYRTDKTVVHGAIREFEEETGEIFEPITVGKIKSCPVIYDDKNLIIFMHVNVDPNEVSRKFNERYKILHEQRMQEAKQSGRRPHDLPEVCGITWLSQESMQQSINKRGVFYSRVRKFLSQPLAVGSKFYELL
jgi:hypothetical protein